MTTLGEALETLTLLPDWEQRYTYLIELARLLPPMETSLKTPENLVKGCTSQVWLQMGWQGETLQVQVDSDALIVRGLVALVWLAYHGKTRKEASRVDIPTLLATTHLMQHLSPNRRNGVASVAGVLKAFVERS